jgi:hypothetical protein
VAKTGHLWKFGFCRDLSLDLGILAYPHRASKFLGRNHASVSLSGYPTMIVPLARLLKTATRNFESLVINCVVSEESPLLSSLKSNVEKALVL